ncbi:thioesterase [Psychrobacter pygoscelis]|uniref:thioesterase n=1 Tax=Psychrobacter pygoscelis TaxID=2488563 RepID=UPI001039E6B5|nr:thioesterase [Psychrobacter pygoscelis]
MSNQELDFDDGVFVFETVIRVRSTEIDVGQYMTIEAMTSAISEVRARFFYSKGIKEINADYQGLVVDNFCLNMLSRVRAREELLFEVGISSLSQDDGVIAIKVTRMFDGSLVAKAALNFVNYDYRLNQVIALSPSVREALDQTPFSL